MNFPSSEATVAQALPEPQIIFVFISLPWIFFLSMNSSNFEPMQLWAMISQFNYVLHEEVLPVFILNLLPGLVLRKRQLLISP